MVARSGKLLETYAQSTAANRSGSNQRGVGMPSGRALAAAAPVGSGSGPSRTPASRRSAGDRPPITSAAAYQVAMPQMTHAGTIHLDLKTSRAHARLAPKAMPGTTSSQKMSGLLIPCEIPSKSAERPVITLYEPHRSTHPVPARNPPSTGLGMTRTRLPRRSVPRNARAAAVPSVAR